MIWSAAADRLPIMCGSATLAIVVSSVVIMVAHMTADVMAMRLVELTSPPR